MILFYQMKKFRATRGRAVLEQRASIRMAANFVHTARGEGGGGEDWALENFLPKAAK